MRSRMTWGFIAIFILGCGSDQPETTQNQTAKNQTIADQTQQSPSTTASPPTSTGPKTEKSPAENDQPGKSTDPAPKQPAEQKKAAKPESDVTRKTEDDVERDITGKPLKNLSGLLVFLTQPDGILKVNKQFSDFQKRIIDATEEEAKKHKGAFILQVECTYSSNLKPTYVIRHGEAIPKELAPSLLKKIESFGSFNTTGPPVIVRWVVTTGPKLSQKLALTPQPIVGAQSAAAPPLKSKPLGAVLKDIQNEAAKPFEPKIPDIKSTAEELADARKNSVKLIDLLKRSLTGKPVGDDFPGIKNWVPELEAAIKQIKTKQTLDVEKLLTRNPNFWKAYFEIVPGDPVLFSLHSGLLLCGGESKRSLYVARIGYHCRTVSPTMLRSLEALISANSRIATASNVQYVKGVKLFDSGKLEDAAKVFEEELKQWPADGLAAYELGMIRFEQKRGKDDPKTVEFPERTKQLYAQSRFHDPFIFHAYQGRDRKNLLALQALVRIGRPAFQSMVMAKRGQLVSIDTLQKLGAVMQMCEAHDLAIAARIAAISRREPRFGYHVEDLKFLEDNLKPLIGDEAAGIVKSLGQGQLRVRALVKQEEAVPQ